MLQKACKIARFTFAIAVTVGMLGVLTFVIACNTGHTSYQLFAVRTGSMSPTIPPESEVLVRKGQYHVGQVISFTYAGETITHRLIKLEGGYATTKGDANQTADPWTIPQRNIVGGVVAAPKHLGWVALFVTRTWAGKVDFVVILALAWWFAFFPDKEEIPIDTEASAEESVLA